MLYLPLGSFGTQRWGPSGMSAPPPAEPAGRQYSHHSGAGAAQGRSPEARSSSFGSSSRDRRDSGGNRGSFGNAPPPYQQQQQQQHRQSGQYGGAPPQNAQSPPVAPTPMQAKPMKKQQQEINLIDDFGPSVRVPAQSLLFDPLAGVCTSWISLRVELVKNLGNDLACLIVCCAVDVCGAN